MKLWDCITERNQKRIAERYEERWGMEFKPPEKDKPISCETKPNPTERK